MLTTEPLDPEYAQEITRDAIVALLSRDPHCWFANILGRALMDIQEHQH